MCVKVGVVRLSPRWFQPDMLLIREMVGGGLPSLLRNGVGSVAVTCVNLAANPFGRCGDRGHGDRQPHRADRQLDDRRFRAGVPAGVRL